MKYHLVQRRDMRKGAAADAQLYYGQVRAGETVSYKELCDTISDISTASKGDVSCVLDGFITVLMKNLVKGKVVRLGDLGTFRMVAGSSGVETEKEFHPSLFRKGRIVFTPSKELKELGTKLTFERLEVKTVTEECDRNHAV